LSPNTHLSNRRPSNKRHPAVRCALVFCCALVLAPVHADTTPAHADAAPAASGRFDLTRSDIVSFVDEVVARDALDRKTVLALLARAEPRATILDRSSRPAERVLEWWEYRDHFVNEKRVADGARFWIDHRQSLESIAAQRGVPPEYIVAILGAETNYGRVTGHDRVLDALMTLAFDGPGRRDFFRSELEQFLLLVREEKLDPLSVTGSYSGAMGAPQFMPSTYRTYAVDGNGDHTSNLWSDWDDVFASVANYISALGWLPGQPVLAEAQLDPDPSFQIDPRNLELNDTIDGLNARGVRIQTALPGTTPVVLVSAEQKDGPAYRVGFKNFYVITRYNHSARYAMAVNDLAEQVALRVHGVPPPGSAAQ
jgi:membrane-bound lytic murein transglycosylase B